MPNNTNLTIFEIKVPRSSDVSPEAMAACLRALPKIKNGWLDKWTKSAEAISLELVAWDQRIYYMAAVPDKLANYFKSQLIAQYPQALIEQVGDYLPYFYDQDPNDNKIPLSSFGQLHFSKAYYFPLKTYLDFNDIDPMTTVLGTLSKLNPKQRLIIQTLIMAPNKNWPNKGYKVAQSQIPTSDPERTIPHPQKNLIENKVSQTGFEVGINILVTGGNEYENEAAITNIAGSFASIAHAEGNSLEFKKPHFWQVEGFFKSIFDRRPIYTPRNQIFTDAELATIFHLPNQDLAKIKNISWGGTLKGEAPENLPIAQNIKLEDKKNINFFAKTNFKNKEIVFGIKKADRRKHIYAIGKTGVGKSTLIANMAINDMRNGEGLAVIDPHGDLCETILDYIPKHRINDIVYLDPNNTDYPFRLNPLEVNDITQADLVASGIVGIFHKLYAHSWGPRLEYILRNTLLTLTYNQNTTLLDVIKILTNNKYRKNIVKKLEDQSLINFWNNEFNTYDNRQRTEAISPILNKVGQFITAPKIRTILERPHSSVNIEDIMNSGKILLLNLSQGRIGEDNAALLGSMFITKIQLAAMNRVNIPESQRRDFYLYVDEFQNFATSSFVNILSEARKYRLNLMVANQYSAQVSEEIQKAIFGNVGTIISFLVGSYDAKLLNQEFGQIYDEADLVHLDNYEIITKLSIDNKTSHPFPAKTIPLPFNKNKNREKVIKISQERYGKPNKIKSQNKPKNSQINIKTQSTTPKINLKYADYKEDITKIHQSKNITRSKPQIKMATPKAIKSNISLKPKQPNTNNHSNKYIKSNYSLQRKKAEDIITRYAQPDALNKLNNTPTKIKPIDPRKSQIIEIEEE